MDATYMVVLVTAANAQEGETIARNLVEDRLAACVNRLTGVTSLFRWEEKLDSAEEELLIIKSEINRFPRIVEKVKSLHSYSCPEIIALPIVDGNPGYLKWLEQSMGPMKRAEGS